MTPKDIQITFVGMKPTEALKKYTKEKISKYQKLWKEATSIEVFLKENVNARGVKSDFRIDMNVYLPNKKVRVEEVGEDMYKNIDKATDTLARQLKKTEEKSHFWDIKRPLKILGIGKEKETEDEKHYSYIPKIESKKELKKLEKYQEQEAIERMEMSGFNQMMFRLRDSGEICMAYKRDKGGYGLVIVNEE